VPDRKFLKIVLQKSPINNNIPPTDSICFAFTFGDPLPLQPMAIAQRTHTYASHSQPNKKALYLIPISPIAVIAHKKRITKLR
jgi:hypothetical protein